MSRFCKPISRTAVASSVTLLSLLFAAAAFLPQTHAQGAPQAPAAPAASPTSLVGTITATATGLLTVKTDAGVERKVTVPEGIKIQRIAPGEKNLSKAATIQFSDLAVGDRVLVRLSPGATDPVTAVQLIAIPQADVAQKQQREREDWQRRGVGGLVKSVDPGTGIILVTSGAGATQKTITLHTSPKTVLRRYAPDSVNYEQAKPAPIEVIQPGDQLRARGDKEPNGTDVTAEEVISGSFRNIAGTIATVNASSNTVTLKDLATKQMVTVHIGPDAQMRKLPENMARMLAASTKPSGAPGSMAPASGGPAGAGGSHNGAPASAGPGAPNAGGSPAPPTPNASAAPSDVSQPRGSAAPGAAQASTPGTPGAGETTGRRGGDPQQMINRAPAIKLADLQKGDAVMLVSTQGTTDVTVITLLAGVEPLLEAPASTQNMLLSNWNMSSGAGEGAAQ